MTLDQGGESVRANPKGFARIQWDSWRPSGWFDDAEFEATVQSFANPDWTEITLNGYRGRWRPEGFDQRYEDRQKLLTAIETPGTPTQMIQSVDDFCGEPAESEGMEHSFIAGYRRIALEGVGQFPPREAPEALAEAVVAHIQ
jgi:hypothetical protein